MRGGLSPAFRVKFSRERTKSQDGCGERRDNPGSSDDARAGEHGGRAPARPGRR